MTSTWFILSDMTTNVRLEIKVRVEKIKRGW